MALASAVSPPTGVDDRYSLRELLWCLLCDRRMVPVVFPDSEWERYYVCGDEACVRLPVPARLIEDLVWFEYAQLYLLPNPWELAQPERGSRLVEALHRVTLGVELFERTYRWQGHTCGSSDD